MDIQIDDLKFIFVGLIYFIFYMNNIINYNKAINKYNNNN